MNYPAFREPVSRMPIAGPLPRLGFSKIACMSDHIAVLKNALSARRGCCAPRSLLGPRSFSMPGGRLKLHPADIYALGAHRGGIDERWFSSTTQADNGPGTPEDEGLSYVVATNGNGSARKVLLKEGIDELGDEFLGSDVMSAQGGWNVLCKFFDNLGPIPHHMHQDEEAAARVGRRGKPEAYYFPPSTNYKRTTSPTRSWDSSQARQRTTCDVPGASGTKATTAFSTIPKPTSSSPAPVGRFPPACCTLPVRR